MSIFLLTIAGIFAGILWLLFGSELYYEVNSFTGERGFHSLILNVTAFILTPIIMIAAIVFLLVKKFFISNPAGTRHKQRRKEP